LNLENKVFSKQIDDLVEYNEARRNAPGSSWKGKLRKIMAEVDSIQWRDLAILITTLGPLMNYKTEKNIAPYLKYDHIPCAQALFIIRLMSDPLRTHRMIRRAREGNLCACNEEAETLAHFVLKCPLTREVWKNTREQGYSDFQIRELVYNDFKIKRYAEKHENSEFYEELQGAFEWRLWLEKEIFPRFRLIIPE
jgi:hypothetical protein